MENHSPPKLMLTCLALLRFPFSPSVPYETLCTTTLSVSAGRMRRKLVPAMLVSCFLWLPSSKLFAEEPLVVSDPFMEMKYDYSPELVYDLYLAPGQPLEIMLQPGENIEHIDFEKNCNRWRIINISGDIGGVERHHLLVSTYCSDGDKKPMIVRTDLRTYRLLLHCSRDASLGSVSWAYPGEEYNTYNSRQRSARSG